MKVALCQPGAITAGATVGWQYLFGKGVCEHTCSLLHFISFYFVVSFIIANFATKSCSFTCWVTTFFYSLT